MGNPAGIFFLNRLESKTGGRDTFCPEVLDWTTRWLAARMDYMDSEESTRLIPEWVQYVNNDTTSPLSDYDVPDPSCTTPTCGFTSFNGGSAGSSGTTTRARILRGPSAT